jgi:hypothetical protein
MKLARHSRTSPTYSSIFEILYFVNYVFEICEFGFTLDPTQKISVAPFLAFQVSDLHLPASILQNQYCVCQRL